MKTVLITGVSSCSGQHAVQHLQADTGVRVHGTTRGSLRVAGLTDCHECDFRNTEDIQRVVEAVQPDQILHLAASSDPSNAGELLQTNVSGTWHLLEACRTLDHPVSVLIVGSAASFGEMRNDESGLDGNRTCIPGSLYGVSRQTQMELGRISSGDDKLRIHLCRTFNLIGPGISDRYVPAALSARIANAASAGDNTLELRDMEAVRDFVDVRDAVAAYFAILDCGKTAYPYSIGRGESVTVGRLAEVLAEEQGADIRFTEQVRTAAIRSGIKRSVANPADLEKDTGWSPAFTLRESVRDMLTNNSNLTASQKTKS